MLLFVGAQSAQIIFVNHLCAINGRVSLGNVNRERKTTQKKDECILVSLKCD